MNDLLSTLGLSAGAIEARKAYIGGSDANIIMSGDNDRIIKLWREKRGEADADDLSGILAVQMGSFTEPLNIAWFEKQTGDEVDSQGHVINHATISYMRATLDGLTADAFGNVRVFEAKHVGVRQTDAEIFAKYVPQLTHNVLCTGLQSAVLSAFKGNGDWVMFEYDLDPEYAAALLDAEARFWECVRTGEPPAPLPLPPAPKPKGVKEYDMAGSNEWAAHAAEYIETSMAADRHEIAKKALKELVPADASKCTGYGVTINRAKNGALRFGKE